MLSSRTLDKTPGVQENREDNSKCEPQNQPVEDNYTMSSSPRNGLGILRAMNTAHSASL